MSDMSGSDSGSDAGMGTDDSRSSSAGSDVAPPDAGDVTDMDDPGAEATSDYVVVPSLLQDSGGAGAGAQASPGVDQSAQSAQSAADTGGQAGAHTQPISIPQLAGMREVGAEAVWSLSGAKPDNGVARLLDNNVR